MPPEAVPFIVAVVAFFGAFIVVVGGVSLWTALPGPGVRTADTPSTAPTRRRSVR